MAGIPVSSGQGTDITAEVVNRNIVRGVQPPGQIWVIKDLKARVDMSGAIKVQGKGLLLAGGNNVGFNGGQSVFATLICQTAPATFVESSTPHKVDNGAVVEGVALDPAGNFRIDDMLEPTPDETCSNPVLLIRSVGGD